MRAQGHYGLAGENSDYCIFICIQVWVCESLFIRRSIPGFTKHKFYILFTEPSAHWNLLADWAGQVSFLTWDACVLCKKAIRNDAAKNGKGGSPYCQKLWRHMWTSIPNCLTATGTWGTEVSLVRRERRWSLVGGRRGCWEGTRSAAPHSQWWNSCIILIWSIFPG